jgi:hypothetical protein
MGYSQAANTFRQLCGRHHPWCWMWSWEDCRCGLATVRPDRLSKASVPPPVACHTTDLLPNLPLPPIQPISICQTREEECSLSAVGHAMRLAGELHRPLASGMTPSLTHDVTTSASLCMQEGPKSFSSFLISVNKIRHVLWVWILEDLISKMWASWFGRIEFTAMNAFLMQLENFYSIGLLVLRYGISCTYAGVNCSGVSVQCSTLMT